MLEDLTILVVDDSVAIRRFVASMIKNMFNCRRVHEAKSANEAVDIMESGLKVDWIFSDWEMPGMSGAEFLLKIRSNPRTADTPFIMITTHNDKDSIVTALQAGVSEYLVKPFTAEMLSQKIRRVIGLQERRVMRRFLATRKNRVDLKFGKSVAMDSSLVNISMSGCLVRMLIFKNRDINIYDSAEIVIHNETDTISMRGRLVRIERDHEEPNLRKFVMAAFEYIEMEPEEKAKLERLIETLRDELPTTP